jgi:adenosylmethionine-8-amino-7-oxononanoate aminotransferase
MANPLACAVALASIDLLLSQDWAGRIASISAGLSVGLASAASLPGVKDVRVLGAVGVVQLDQPVDMVRMTNAVLRRGVWVRPFRDLVYTMPPYLCTDEEIATICSAITESIAEGN